MTTPRAPLDLAELDAVLSRLGAKLAAWEVQALFLGGIANPDLGFGPFGLFKLLFGDEKEVQGDTLEKLNADMGVLMGAWNSLTHSRDVVLSDLPMSKQATVTELRALAERRRSEIAQFMAGLTAGGGDDVYDLYRKQGQEIIRALYGLTKGIEGYQAMLATDEDLPRETLDYIAGELQTAKLGIENAIGRLLDIAEKYRRGGVDRAVDRANRTALRVGRNAPCPCGSGAKFKNCCGGISEAARSS